MALQVERAQLLRAAVHVGDPDRPPGDDEVLDDDLARRHDLRGVGDGRALRQRKAQDLPVRGTVSRQQVHRLVSQHGERAVVGDVGQQPPVTTGGAAVLAAEEDLPLATVTLLHAVHQPPAVGRRGQHVLRDALVGEAARDVQPVGATAAVEIAEPHLLLEAGRVGAPGEPEAPPVGAPGHRATHQVDMGDRLVDHLAAGDVEDVQRPVLGPVLRQRDGQPGAVRGRDEPVDRGLARRVDGLGVHDDPL